MPNMSCLYDGRLIRVRHCLHFTTVFGRVRVALLFIAFCAVLCFCVLFIVVLCSVSNIVSLPG